MGTRSRWRAWRCRTRPATRAASSDKSTGNRPLDRVAASHGNGAAGCCFPGARIQQQHAYQQRHSYACHVPDNFSIGICTSSSAYKHMRGVDALLLS